MEPNPLNPNSQAQAQASVAGMEGISADAGFAPAADDSQASDPKTYPEAPFALHTAQNEEVVLSNGHLQYTVTDFVLPGRNGFDLAITRRYNTESANLRDVGPVFNGTDGFKTGSRPNTHNLRMYGLGYGWEFMLPSIEFTPAADRSQYVEYSPTLHLADGRKFVIENGALKDHPLQDVVFSETSGSLSHPYSTGLTKSYHYKVSYKDGSADYFTKALAGNTVNEARLCARQDRFGNTICYTLNENGGMAITDTWGRSIVLKKDGAQLAWALPDGSAIRYTVSSSGEERLLAAEDQMGRKTSYDYYSSAEYSALCRLYPSDGTNISIGHLLLKEVRHPSGAVSSYTYATPAAPMQLYLTDEGGFRRFFPIYSRKDTADGMVYNDESYEYMPSPDSRFIQQGIAKYAGEITERHTFNSRAQLTGKDILHSLVLVEHSDYTYGENAAAANYKQLVKEDHRRYMYRDESSFMQTITQYTYTADKKANVAEIDEQFPGDTTLNRKTTMQYGAYSILTEKAAPMNAETTVIERYALHTGLESKVAEYRRVYEKTGGTEVLKEKTRYIYSSLAADKYCLTAERRCHADEGASLEASAQYYEKTFSYNSAKYTHAPVTQTQHGLLNADGLALPNITEHTDYDSHGRVTQTTNANGGVSNFYYDALGRLVRQVLPAVEPATGGAAVRHETRLEYNDAQNYITQTDELGYKQRVEYNAAGLVYRVYLAAGDGPNLPAIGGADVLLEEYLYDNKGRLAEKREFTDNGSLRCATQYTYDGYDRVLSLSIPQTSYYERYIYTDACTFMGKKAFQVEKTVLGHGPDSPDVTTTTYANALGLVTQELLASLVVASHTYDKAGNRLTATDGRESTATFTFDYAGRQLSASRVVSGETVRTENSWDNLGRLRCRRHDSFLLCKNETPLNSPPQGGA